jgi:hypothetical protein
MSPSTRVRRALPLVVLLVAVVVAAALSGPEAGDEPLDPTSTGPLGTKALVDSLEELGVPVEVRATLPEAQGVALLLEDHLSEEETDRARAWVERGGVLVVADPVSSLTPTPIGTAAVAGFGEAPATPSCDLAALGDVHRVLPAADSGVYAAPRGAVACFPRGEGHWLVAEAVGEGTIVALGGPDVFVNARLAEPGHPELMAGLLGGGDGLVYLRPEGAGTVDTLVDLIGTNVWMFALQLALAFLVYAAWRARRLGPPVEEPQSVSIPASELVAAVGNLLQETQARQRVAAILREDLRRTFGQRLGLPRAAPLDDLVAAVAARTGDDRAEVARILGGPPPTDDAALVELSQAAERLRSRALTPMTTRRST